MRSRFLIILIILASFVHAQQNTITNFTGYKILEESYVYTISQDSLGNLWIGTSNGLFKYNGIAFDYFNHDELVNDNFISASIYHRGVVWLGHRTGDITAIHGHDFKAMQLAEEGMSSIVDFAIDGKNQLWAASYSDGIFIIGNDGYPEHYQFVDNEETIQTICFVEEEEVLIGSDDKLTLFKLSSDGTISPIKTIGEVPPSKIVSIQALNESNYIVATEDKGVYSLNLSQDSIQVQTIGNKSMYKDLMISDLLLISPESAWVSTMGQGLLKLYRVSSHSTIWKSEYIPENTPSYIKCLFQDRDENIWLGNYGSGITRLSRNPFNWQITSDPDEDHIAAITAGNNLRWVATQKKLECYNFLGQIIKEYTLKDLLIKDDITALYYDTENTLWIGTNGGGVYRFSPEDEKPQRLPISNGLLENTITSLAGTSLDLWIGTKKGLARYNLIDNKVEWFTIQSAGLPHNVINHIFIDSKLVIWFTTQSNTLMRFENNQFHRIEFPTKNGLSILKAITSDHQNNLWISSHGMGVYKIVGDSISNFRESEGLYSNYCYAIHADRYGYIWVTHRGGLTRIHSEVLAIRSIQEYAGIEINDDFEVNNSCMDDRGILWLGTSRGLLSYNPEDENKKMLAPIINLLSVKINGVDYDYSKRLRLPPGRYKIKFEYIGVSLKEPRKVKYQYRLKGYDEEWSDITLQREAVFSGIGSGKYTFELNASSSDGITTSKPFRINITIKKPIWVQWWFYILVFATGFLLIYGFLRRREYKLVKANIQLERRVHERTLEISRQKDEIQRQGDVIKKKNLDITDSIKYARTIQSAIFPPEEILEAALPEYFMINKPKDIVSGDFCWYTKSNGEYVIAVTDCTGHGVPGSIMSMLGITLFNEVVNNLGITNSGEILELMRKKVISALNQHKKENPSYDGMNVGLCVLKNRPKRVQYSGAFHNLIHINQGELTIIKAERTPIGFTPLAMPAFETHDIKYARGDMFYMFSDGYQDQFGGEEDRKFTNRRLLNLFREIHDKSMADQKLVLEQTLSRWMGNREQTDDIIVLGFRL